MKSMMTQVRSEVVSTRLVRVHGMGMRQGRLFYNETIAHERGQRCIIGETSASMHSIIHTCRK